MAEGVRAARRGLLAAVAVLAVLVVVVLAAVLIRGGSRPAVPGAEPSPSVSGVVIPTASGSASAAASPGSASPTASTAPVIVPPPSTSPPSPPPQPPPSPSPPPSTSSPKPAPQPAPPYPAVLKGQDITVLPAAGKVVALTFDAGANSAGLPKILKALADQHIPATFFLTGDWAAANPAGVSAIRAAGHRIGNHSMSHPNFPSLTAGAIRDQVLGAQAAILAAGADPRPLFRFPYGDRDARTIAAVNNLGYVAVRWTVDTLGWKGTSGGLSVQQVSDRAVAALQPGEIVLMHLGSNPTDGTTLDADALPAMIARMRAAGYGFVTLGALLTR